MKTLLHILNVAFSGVIALGILGFGALMAYEHSLGPTSDKVASGVIALTAFFGSITIIRQALWRGNVLTLLLVAPLAAGVTWACGLALSQGLGGLAFFERLAGSEVVPLSLLFLNGYLLLWERRGRVEVEGDELIENFKAITSTWPSLLYIFILLGIEWLTW